MAGVDRPADAGLVDGPTTFRSDDRSTPATDSTIHRGEGWAARAHGAQRSRSIQQSPASVGGRPRKTLRDIALTMHLEYLVDCAGMEPGLSKLRVAEYFGIKGDDKVRRDSVDRIVRKIRKKELLGLTKIIASSGFEPDKNGLVPARLLVKPCRTGPDGSFEGYAVAWGRQEAFHGRGTITRTANSMDLDLEKVPQQ